MSRRGIILVDHGSRLDESNRLIADVAAAFADYQQQRGELPESEFPGDRPIVEPAHMELAEPSIATAYAQCVARGAGEIVVLPYFLGPGKHWTTDIPALTAAAARQYPQTSYQIAAPLGLDPLILELLAKRLAGIRECGPSRSSSGAGEP